MRRRTSPNQAHPGEDAFGITMRIPRELEKPLRLYAFNRTWSLNRAVNELIATGLEGERVRRVAR